MNKSLLNRIGEEMAIPDFQSIMYPFLDSIKDGNVHTMVDLLEILAQHFNLTNEEREELLQSGRQRIFDNRVSWTKTYFSKALLIDVVGRGKIRITDRGKAALQNASSSMRIDVHVLNQYSEFLTFHQRRNNDSDPGEKKTPEPEGGAQTPEETLETSYQTIRRNLSVDLLERVKQCSPHFFESLVVDLLVAMGYGGSKKDAGRAVGQSGDGGIDGIIKEDKLGLDIVYIQAKRWEGTVGRPTVQAFAGSLEGMRARKGVLITTSRFTQDAQDYVNRIEKKIVLIDGDTLVQLMIDHNIGVTEFNHYVLKRIDIDYFED